MDKSKVIEHIGSILAEFEEIDQAYVFGSFLKRDEFHDIDVAIHLSKEQSPYQRFKLTQRAAGDLERGFAPRINFDVRILNQAPADFQYEVISKGVLVLERDRESRVDYEAHLISEYLDLKYMYDYFDRTFLAGT